EGGVPGVHAGGQRGRLRRRARRLLDRAHRRGRGRARIRLPGIDERAGRAGHPAAGDGSMKYVDEYREAEDAQKMLAAIHRRVTREWTLMEVCGGQTHTLIKFGIDRMLPEQVQ